MNSGTPPTHKSQFLAPARSIFLAVILMLIAGNIYATVISIRIKADLQKANAALITKAQFQRSSDQLHMIAQSTARKQFSEDLRRAIAAVDPKSVIWLKTRPEWPDAHSFLLYVPDDTVTLNVNLNKWHHYLNQNRIPKERIETLKLPLKSERLYSFSFGYVDDLVAIKLGDKTVTADLPEPGTRTYSQTRLEYRRTSLLGSPHVFSREVKSFAAAYKGKEWYKLGDIVFYRKVPRKNPEYRGQEDNVGVHVVAWLSSTSEKLIDPSMFLAAQQDLRLQWDPTRKAYKIVGMRSHGDRTKQ